MSFQTEFAKKVLNQDVTMSWTTKKPTFWEQYGEAIILWSVFFLILFAEILYLLINSIDAIAR